MEQLAAREQREPRVASAMSLLIQGEQYLQAGFYQQAELLLIEAWRLSSAHDLELRSRAAWQIVWVKLLTRDYHSAATWIEQVGDPPHIPTCTWSVERLVLVELVEQLAKSPTLLVPALPESQHSMHSLQPLSIRSLGAFTITRGSARLKACRARKAVALLRYLLTRPHHRASREELMEMLWPEAAPERAAHSLHVIVSTLRQHLDDQEESYLTFSAGAYALNPEARIIHDCACFIEKSEEADRYRRSGDLARAQQAYTAALSHYQGDYVLDDYDLTWATAERERMLTRYLVVLEHLGTIWMQRSCFDAAVECFQLILQRDEFREDMHCQIMRCYLRLGRRSDAILQYQRCARALADSLGLDPMAETHALYQEILADRG